MFVFTLNLLPKCNLLIILFQNSINIILNWRKKHFHLTFSNILIFQIVFGSKKVEKTIRGSFFHPWSAIIISLHHISFLDTLKRIFWHSSPLLSYVQEKKYAWCILRYGQTCVQRPPSGSGPQKSSRCRQEFPLQRWSLFGGGR